MQTRTVTVLLVEDDEVDVELVRRAFKNHRIANPLMVAQDGVAALELLRSGQVPRPHIILLDLNMPRMGGLEFLENLRSDPQLRDSVVFVLTTSNDEADRCQAYAKNVAGYCVKSRVGADFLELTGLLKAYWRVVELPE